VVARGGVEPTTFHTENLHLTNHAPDIKDPIQSLLNSANLWIDPVRMQTRHVKSAYMRTGRVEIKKPDFYVKTLGDFGNF